MSRSGYSEDYDEEFPNALELFRANIDRTIDGKRGQAFLRDLLGALDALPEKRLIADDLEHQGEVCAIGALGKARGIDMKGIDPEDAKCVAKMFGITAILAREIVFENDEGAGYWAREKETPEARWQRMREWVSGHIKN